MSYNVYTKGQNLCILSVFLDSVFSVAVMKGHLRILLICIVTSFLVTSFFSDVTANTGNVDSKIEIMKFKIEIIN